MNQKIQTFACLILLTLTLTVYPQTKNTFSRSDAYLNDLTKKDLFSGSVLIAEGGRIILSKGYGLANRELDVPNTPKTKFRLASVTKAFTAEAIMILQDRGSLSTPDTLCKYIDNCPAAWAPVTLRMLLDHTSGITEFGKPAPADDGFKRKPMTTAATLERAKTFSPDFTPGEKFAYSSQDYVLLAHVIEKASGKSYEEFIRENILKPLEMAGTGIDRHKAIVKNRASGYARAKDGTISNFDYFDSDYLFGAGNMYSTTEDLYRFARALTGGRLLKPDSLAEMVTPHLENTGYAWEIFDADGLRKVRVDGRSFGFSNSVLTIPDRQLTVIVLANIDTAGAVKIADDLAAIMLAAK